MTVDWSKAPEGATHYFPDSEDQHECWGKIENNKLIAICEAIGENDWFEDEYFTIDMLPDLNFELRPA